MTFFEIDLNKYRISLSGVKGTFDEEYRFCLFTIEWSPTNPIKEDFWLSIIILNRSLVLNILQPPDPTKNINSLMRRPPYKFV